MTTPKKVNLFDQFDKTAQKSEGLKHLERTTISLKEEQRTKNCIAVVTPSEHKAIRSYARNLEEQFDKRVTVSDLSRELFLLVLGQDTQNPEIREDLIRHIKDTI